MFFHLSWGALVDTLLELDFARTFVFRHYQERGARQAEGAWRSPRVPCMQSGLRPESGVNTCYVERTQGNSSMGTRLLADPQADKTPSKRNISEAGP